MIEQRTLEWQKLRIGSITASEFHNLMKDSKQELPLTDEDIAQLKADYEKFMAENPKSKKQLKIPETKKVVVPFSDASYTYLNRKIMERYIPREGGTLDEYIEMRNVQNRAMQYGTDMEDVARQRYADDMGYEVLTVEYIPIKGYEGFAGASADGIIRGSHDGFGGIEIKNPFYIEHHLDNLLLKTPQDLLDLHPDYYWQIRLCMLAWDLDWYDFVSFCPYISHSKQLKVLRVYRDKDIDNEIYHRLDLAREYMRQKIDEINNTQLIVK